MAFRKHIPIRAVEIIVKAVFQSFAPKPRNTTAYIIIRPATMYVFFPFNTNILNSLINKNFNTYNITPWVTMFYYKKR